MKMTPKNVPKCMWDFALSLLSRIYGCWIKIHQIVWDMRWSQEKTPVISELCKLDFWDLVWFFPGMHPSVRAADRWLGRWVGVSHNIGNKMCFWIIPVSGMPIAGFYFTNQSLSFSSVNNRYAYVTNYSLSPKRKCGLTLKWGIKLNFCPLKLRRGDIESSRKMDSLGIGMSGSSSESSYPLNFASENYGAPENPRM